MYAYRRGVATTLRERGADYEDITEALCQESYDSTRSYVSALLKRRRVASVLRLLDEPKVAA
jgi:DNA polymerase II small subunit/DNA polymerase delta subunit B